MESILLCKCDRIDQDYDRDWISVFNTLLQDAADLPGISNLVGKAKKWSIIIHSTDFLKCFSSTWPMLHLPKRHHRKYVQLSVQNNVSKPLNRLYFYKCYNIYIFKRQGKVTYFLKTFQKDQKHGKLLVLWSYLLHIKYHNIKYWTFIWEHFWFLIT